MGRKSRARTQAALSIGKFELRDLLRHEALMNERFYEDYKEPCICCALQGMEEQKQDNIIASQNNKSVNNDERAADVRSVEESEASISSKNDEEKALKRKLKKERQKEKKNCAKQIMDEAMDKKGTSDENNCDPCEPEIPTITTTITFDTTLEEQKHEPPAADNNADDNSETQNNDDNDTGNDDDIDFSLDAPVVPAFVQSMIHTKNNTIKMMKKSTDNNKIKDTHLMSDQSIPENSDGFTTVKKGTKQAPAKFNKTPEGFAIEALKMVRNSNFPLAINYLTRAINLDPIDSRHYINRSFCYLRSGRYAEALADIKFASEHFTNVTDLAKAKCREGQAFCGLQNYEAAEVAFRHCLKLTPDCPFVKRELRRMQVCQMVSMGFREREAISALQEHPNTTDAIISLSSKIATNGDPYDSVESATDDEIYESDEEEEPSNESLLSIILNYDPNLLEEPRAPEPIAPKISRPRNNSAKSESTDRELRVIKTIVPVVKSDPTVNEMAIWVGNVTPFVTENMLTKGFGKFGKVTSVWRAPTGTYCFVNFQTAAGAKKALEEASISGGTVNISGHLLLLKHATPKSLKNCH